ncbi:MAG: hypothetical protein ACKO2T_21605, partial [Microcystis aeruginosa]
YQLSVTSYQLSVTTPHLPSPPQRARSGLPSPCSQSPDLKIEAEITQRGTPASGVTLKLLQMYQQLRVSIPPKN